jgi:hypothetical protein
MTAYPGDEIRFELDGIPGAAQVVGRDDEGDYRAIDMDTGVEIIVPRNQVFQINKPVDADQIIPTAEVNPPSLLEKLLLESRAKMEDEIVQLKGEIESRDKRLAQWERMFLEMAEECDRQKERVRALECLMAKPPPLPRGPKLV